jgi:hypothetical protein
MFQTLVCHEDGEVVEQKKPQAISSVRSHDLFVDRVQLPDAILAARLKRAGLAFHPDASRCFFSTTYASVDTHRFWPNPCNEKVRRSCCFLCSWNRPPDFAQRFVGNKGLK